jgi:hypothetical protein
MMYKKTNVLIPIFAMLLVAVFCTTATTSHAMSTMPGIYHFAGRVMNQQDKPVNNCSVILIKRISQTEEKQEAEQGQAEVKQEVEQGQAEEKKYIVTSEEVVSTTDEVGNYNFAFEPLTADNFWVIFKADGYRNRSVELNKLMRSRFFQKPNKSPIKLDVVLEKE